MMAVPTDHWAPVWAALAPDLTGHVCNRFAEPVFRRIPCRRHPLGIVVMGLEHTRCMAEGVGFEPTVACATTVFNLRPI